MTLYQLRNMGLLKPPEDSTRAADGSAHMQGFPKDYIIDRDYNWKPYPIAKQVARIGNSVVPIMAQKLVEANCPYLKVGERIPNFRTEEEETGQIKFA